MEDIYKILHEGFEFGHGVIIENDRRFSKVESSLQAYVVRAKETLALKTNPKPVKRFMKTIQDESEDEEAAVNRRTTEKSLSSEAGDLRPIRSAKSKANMNLKEVPINSKMRNENNIVSIKTERSSTLMKSNSRDSIKENETPNAETVKKRRSPDDEGIQSAAESEISTSKRSNSVEFISAKLVEIDITGDDATRMPPPALAKKAIKKTRNKQKKQDEPVADPKPLRITRSKIKQEKTSLDPTEAQQAAVVLMPPPVEPIQHSKGNESVANVSKKGKKKCPLPFLIKIEPEDDKCTDKEKSNSEILLNLCEQPADQNIVCTHAGDETFDVPQTVNKTAEIATPAMNETVTIEQNPNSTVTLSQNNHDSLMTEDNDVSMEELPPPLPKKQMPQASVPLKLKKNEVFNPYLSSPVKQRVQAFEKHAQGGTPTKYNTMPPKYSTLKNGTPSKIALYSKTTPLSNGIGMKQSSSASSVNVASGQKISKTLKKMNSLSQESLDDIRKIQPASSIQLLEEKRKAREEIQKQAQIRREAIEKEKRDQVIKQQMERDEKYRKIMKEKEEKQRMEALKKKMLKENQAKKYAEEKAKKQEPTASKPEAQAAKMNDSLHLKMQKQIMLEKTAQQKKAESKNTYSFDMLHTDDSTDDESRPSQKRPPQPDWSKKQKRKPMIVMQSHINSNVLDSLFSVQPISVDLREIFPSIDSRKLIRNSSAIWRTPPKHY